MHRYLQFSNVGRSKFSGRKLLHPEIISVADIEEVAIDGAKKYLCSREIDCVYHAKTNEGRIYTSQQEVGKFSIVEIKNAKTTNKPR